MSETAPSQERRHNLTIFFERIINRVREKLDQKSERREEARNLSDKLIAHFNTQERMSRGSDQGAYPVVNDNDLGQAYLKALKKIEINGHKLKVAVIIGEGAAISMSPELVRSGIDLVICIDRAPTVISMINSEMELLRELDNLDFENRLKMIAQKNGVINTSYWLHDFKRLGRSLKLGELFFLSSLARLKRVRASLQKITICPVFMNFVNGEDVQNLKAILGDRAEIVLINFTNAFDNTHGRKLAQSAGWTKSNMPLSPNMVVMHSNQRYDPPSGDGAISMPPTTLERYYTSDMETEDNIALETCQRLEREEENRKTP